MWHVLLATRDPDGRTSSATTVTDPSSPYYILDQEEISDAKEQTAKDENTTKKNHLMTRANLPTKGDLGAKQQDTAQRCTVDPSSPTDLPGCLTHELHRSRRKHIWDRVKRMTSIFVRSATRDSAACGD